MEEMMQELRAGVACFTRNVQDPSDDEGIGSNRERENRENEADQREEKMRRLEVPSLVMTHMDGYIAPSGISRSTRFLHLLTLGIILFPPLINTQALVIRPIPLLLLYTPSFSYSVSVVCGLSNSHKNGQKKVLKI